MECTKYVHSYPNDRKHKVEQLSMGNMLNLTLQSTKSVCHDESSTLP